LCDTFGTAYSHCGIGNAYRMLGDYRKALASFSRASTLYKKIGDRVSYSYTLWSIGTTHKMLHEYASADNVFKEAQVLFKKTKDPRGLIYCQLGFGEIALLKGNNATALRKFKASLSQARRYGFRVEACHAAMLLSYAYGKKNMVCYNSLGMKLDFNEAPFNIP
jgi:tetratricopeptide (TPR) repeat protein